MAAGSRRFRVTVQQSSPTDDESNQPIDGWVTFCGRWAEVVATGGSERYKGRQIQANATHVITLISDSVTRHITASMRVLWRGRIINLVVARPLDGKIREIELQGIELVVT